MVVAVVVEVVVVPPPPPPELPVPPDDTVAIGMVVDVEAAGGPAEVLRWCPNPNNWLRLHSDANTDA